MPIAALLLVVGSAVGAGTIVLDDVREPDTVPTYLIICPKKAVQAVMPLATWRAEHGQTVRIATAGSIYRAFGDGEAAPAAIRDFIQSLRKAGGHEGRLKFLLLVGTPARGAEAGLFLPTWHAASSARRGVRISTDSPYGTPAGSRVPDIAVGRLPARSLDDLRVMVRKTLARERAVETGPWRRRLDAFAGQGAYGPVVDAAIERVAAAIFAGMVPNYVDVTMTYANPGSVYCYAPPRFSDYLVERLNGGPAILLYVGHGGTDGFDSFTWKGKMYPIVHRSAVAAVRNPHHRTVVVALCCSTGRFHGAEPCIGERLVAAPGGPAAFIGSSDISSPYGNGVFGSYLTEAMLNTPPPTVGEAFLKAQRWLAEDRKTSFRLMIDLAARLFPEAGSLDADRADYVLLYNLLGDPALSTGVVRAAATLEAPATAILGETVSVRAGVPFKTGTAHFSLAVSRESTLIPLTAVGPDRRDAEAAMIRTHARANNKVLVAGSVPVTAGRAVWSLRLPPDGPTGTLFINVYASDGRRDAAASRSVRIQRSAFSGQPSAVSASEGRRS